MSEFLMGNSAARLEEGKDVGSGECVCMYVLDLLYIRVYCEKTSSTYLIDEIIGIMEVVGGNLTPRLLNG